ncbi:MAG: tRNA(Glu)-specific nuclease WapA precursor [Firmicutes bacterium ADurb.Bin193]|nr:MAG: tRNA(Glu)-specific nuclease WapA precursor [Firmicutes bacterium ADurb.Bin193]
MKNLKLLLLPAILTVIALVGCQSPASASTSGELDDQYTYAMKSIYGKDFEPPFLVEKDNTGVDFDSGALSLTENLITLPGKNGLDFNYSIDYKSTRNDYYSPWIEENLTVPCQDYYYTYYYYKASGSLATIYVPFKLESQVKEVMYSSYDELNDFSYAKGDEDLAYIKASKFSYTAHAGRPVPVYLNKEVQREVDRYHDDRIYYYKPSPSAYGWIARTPNLEGTTQNSDITVLKGQFTDEKGAVRQYKLSVYYPNYPNINGYKIRALFIDDPQGRQYRVVEMSDETIYDSTGAGAIQHPKGFKYTIKFQNDEGVSYYVTTNKYYDAVMYISAVEDRYGNMIIYKPDDEGGIIDSYGRRINITTEENAAGITGSVSIAENGAEKELVRYEQKSVTSAEDGNDIFRTDNDYVMTVTRRESETQDIEESSNVTKYIARMYEWDAGPLANSAYKVQTVEYPTGAQRKYEFFGSRNTCYDQDTLYVSKTYNLENASGTEKKNETAYVYTKRTDISYPRHDMSGNYDYTTQVTTTGGGTDIYEYDAYERLESKSNYMTGEQISYKYEYEPIDTDSLEGPELVAERSLIKEISNIYGATEYDYDNGRLVYESGPNKPGVWYWYSNKYKILCYTGTWRDAHNYVLTIGELSADEKSIVTSTVKENGAVKSVTHYTHDAYGNVTKETVTDGTATLAENNYLYTYHTDGSYEVKSWAEDVADADGNTVAEIATIKEYDNRGRLQSVQDPKSNTVTYTYDTPGRVRSETHSSDNLPKSYDYDIVNNIITVTNENGRQEKHFYTPLGLYDHVDLFRDNSWITAYRYEYDNLGRLKGETDYRDYNASGENTEKYSAVYTLDSKGRKDYETITDINNNVVYETDYSYTLADSAAANMCGMPLRPDSTGQFSISDKLYAHPESGPVEMCFDLNGNYSFFEAAMSQQTNGIEISVYGDGNLLYTTELWSDKYVPRFTVNVAGVGVLKLVTKRIAGEYYYSTIVPWAAPSLYAAPKKVNKMTVMPKGDTGQAMPVVDRYAGLDGKVYGQTVSGGGKTLTTQSFYDRSGNRIKIKAHGDGGEDRESETAYNYQNKPVRETDGEPSVYKTSEYDALGRLTSYSDYEQNITSVTYDKLGRQTVLTTPFEGGTNSVVKQYYDNNGNLTKTLTQDNAAGEAQHFKKEEFSYDAKNRMVAAIAYEQDDKPVYAQYKYDAAGNPLAVYTGLSAPLDTQTEQGEDSDFAVTRYEYNELDQVKKSTDALGQQAAYRYNLAGAVTAMVDRLGNTTAFAYNLWGNVTAAQTQKDGVSESVTTTYAKGGLLKSTSDASGTTEYKYAAVPMLQLTEEKKGNIINAYGYDPYGNRTSYRLKQNGSVILWSDYHYDRRDRMDYADSASGRTQYTYSPNGNITGEMTDYDYDAVTNPVFSADVSAAYGYNAAGLLISKQSKNQHNDTILQNAYAYRPDGNISGKTDSETGMASYAYDGLGRLTGEQGADTAYSYGYDDYGNRRQMTVAANGAVRTVDYTYDKNNRLTKESATADGVQTNALYGYDANGNQISKVSYSLSDAPMGAPELSLDAPQAEVVLSSYDGFNRLKASEIIKNGEKKRASYTYNAAGIRTSKTVDGVTTRHLLDGVNVAADVTNGQVTAYIRGLSLIAVRRPDGELLRYVTDGHGDVRALMEQGGNVAKRYSYDAFGNEGNTDGSDVNPFRYCGEYFDKESGSIYLRSRYYDPSTGRFIQEDSAQAGLNWYTYCENNPVNLIDPFGEDAIWITTSEESVKGQGHSSILVQDTREGKWYYFYWGDKATYFVEVPWQDGAMSSLDAFNEWLTGMNLRDNSTGYTTATFIEGDFNASVDFFKTTVATTDISFVGVNEIKDKQGNVIGYENEFKNEGYDLATKNCMHVSLWGFNMGTLKDGTNAGEFLISIGSKRPNDARKVFDWAFFNQSFTRDAAKNDVTWLARNSGTITGQAKKYRERGLHYARTIGAN